MKTDVYNLIILDETGSMSGVKGQTISGCNETLDTIRSLQTRYSDTQNHYVSIYAFHSKSSVPSRYLIKNAPIGEVSYIESWDYNPDGYTPLYDALGGTLSDLRATVALKELAIGSVTIITDGLENDSRYYSHWKVASMIRSLKRLGWNFNFIGANFDVERTARSLNIGNYLSFNQTDMGTREMFERERRARHRYYGRVHAKMSKIGPIRCEADRVHALYDLSMADANYFTEPEHNTNAGTASMDNKTEGEAKE